MHIIISTVVTDMPQAAVSQVLARARYDGRFCYIQGREFTHVWRGDNQTAAGPASVCWLL